mmetsp:Transcript_1167/g.3737  ORF Transcript_1167/g.3737 Transcript_1167/m.3737 type:complete len:220 (+) Transcript_1167:350-1009(+)
MARVPHDDVGRRRERGGEHRGRGRVRRRARDGTRQGAGQDRAHAGERGGDGRHPPVQRRRAPAGAHPAAWRRASDRAGLVGVGGAVGGVRHGARGHLRCARQRAGQGHLTAARADGRFCGEGRRGPDRHGSPRAFLRRALRAVCGERYGQPIRGGSGRHGAGGLADVHGDTGSRVHRDRPPRGSAGDVGLQHCCGRAQWWRRLRLVRGRGPGARRRRAA